jgi:hypothetical protein
MDPMMSDLAALEQTTACSRRAHMPRCARDARPCRWLGGDRGTPPPAPRFAAPADRPGTMKAMSNADASRHHPVAVTHLPKVRCSVFRRTVAHPPGQATLVLTKHYEKAHPELGAGDPAHRADAASRALTLVVALDREAALISSLDLDRRNRQSGRASPAQSMQRRPMGSSYHVGPSGIEMRRGPGRPHSASD